MLTEIGRIVIGATNIEKYPHVYGKMLGLQKATSATNEFSNNICAYAAGPSLLEFREDTHAVMGLLPSGDSKKWEDLPGTFNHLAFLVANNNQAFKEILNAGGSLGTTEGPALQPMNHSYMQRTLLQFTDPNGLIIQISECVDPRDHVKERQEFKINGRVGNGRNNLWLGIDHIHLTPAHLEEASSFYGDILGLDCISMRKNEDSDELVFAIGMTDIEFSVPHENPREEYGPGIVQRLGFWTDNVDNVYKHLIKEGIKTSKVSTNEEMVGNYQTRPLTVLDPDGLPIDICQKF